ncbi:MAG: hypothetical protein RLZZ74_1680 [Cyanobacteriota bacterium]
MALAKIADLYPNYREDIFGGNDIKGFTVYDYTNDKIGTVYDIIVDETGKFRYLVIDTGFWIFGKKVLLPIGKASIDYAQERIYVKGLTKDQAQSLPEYDDDMTIGYDYEEKVRTVYREGEYDNNNTAPLNKNTTTAGYDSNAYNSHSYHYDHEPNLYDHKEAEIEGQQNLKLYEERLVANKKRILAGTVKVSKKVETETATVSVPVEKERVIIKRITPRINRVISPGEANFSDTEIARFEIYEESAAIEKQAFVREEVDIHKQVQQDIVTAEETIRREELEVETDGNKLINKDPLV